jgi:hypothetical protein
MLASFRTAVILTNGGREYDNAGPLGIILFQLTFPVDPTSVTAPADWMFNTFASGTETIVQ